MPLRQHKPVYFLLEGINSLAVTFYFSYVYFFTRQEFGFSNKANLLLAAITGIVCVPGSIYGGRFAERRGYFAALKLGFSVMLAAIAAGLVISSPAALVVTVLAAAIGMCFTWAPLEALVSQGETRAGVQNMIGLYNVVWAATAALAYFAGGALLDYLGRASLFYVPAALYAVQLVLTFRVAAQVRSEGGLSGIPAAPEAHPHPAGHARRFLWMSWLANPFAYVAMNTMIALTPGIASRLGLSTMLAGFACSIWLFTRFFSFALLWRWDGWHYRAGWLLAAYLGLIVCFAAFLTVPNLAVLIVAQVFLGLALGLLYYSSLFYSMDLSDARGEHGGIHEAVIGAGNFAGPALGALTLHLAPGHPGSSAVAVTALLVAGMGAILWVWRGKPAAEKG